MNKQICLFIYLFLLTFTVLKVKGLKPVLEPNILYAIRTLDTIF